MVHSMHSINTTRNPKEKYLELFGPGFYCRARSNGDLANSTGLD